MEALLTFTSLLRPIYWPSGKTAIHFSRKKTLFNTVTRYDTVNFFFWPIGDSINGVPLYVTIEVLCDKDDSQRILKLSFVLSGLSFPSVSFRN